MAEEKNLEEFKTFTSGLPKPSQVDPPLSFLNLEECGLESAVVKFFHLSIVEEEKKRLYNDKKNKTARSKEKEESDVRKNYAALKERFSLLKQDVKKSCTKWSTGTLVKYLSKTAKSRLPIEFEPMPEELEGHEGLDDVVQKAEANLKEIVSVCLLVEATTEQVYSQLGNNGLNEATRRFFVNALMTPILRQSKTMICSEAILYPDPKKNQPHLPRAAADYAIYKKDFGEIQLLGCIEVKSHKTFNAKAIVQCMMTMVSLQTRAKGSLVGVVTDGYNYVLMRLTRDRFHLITEDEGKKCKVFRVGDRSQLEVVVSALHNLIQECIVKS